MKKFFKKMFLGLLFPACMIGLYETYQLFMYRIEDGVFVADKYASPPASKMIYYNGQPLFEAVTSTRTVGRIDSDGNRHYDDVPLMNWKVKWAHWNALRKFPILENCLKPEARHRVDISKFDWTSMRTKTQVKVCLYHLAAKLRDPSKFASWTEEQGFSARFSPSSSDSGASRISATWRKTGKMIDTPYAFFSKQTLMEQYTLWSLLLGQSGRPEWTIYLNNNHEAIRFFIRNSPNK